jgi:hypothetical protein
MVTVGKCPMRDWMLGHPSGAGPFSGGAFTLTVSASPTQSTTLSRDDPDTTFRLKRPMRYNP